MAVKFSEPQEYILTTTQDINLFLAGVGSGKTHLSGFITGYFLKNFPHVFGFIGANTHHQLSASTLFRTREVWKEYFGWIEGRDYVSEIIPPKSFNTEHHNFKNYKGIMSFRWGAVAFVGSLENAKVHDGKEFGWATLDESKDSKEEDIKHTILTRLRSVGIYIDVDTGQLTSSDLSCENNTNNKPFNPLYIFTSPAKVGWINEWFELDDFQDEILDVIYDKENFFWKEKDDKCVVISSTFHNEENLPAGYIDKQLNNNTEENGKRLIYANPFVKAGGEFYSSFSRKAHVKEVDFDIDLPIHIAFDQNVVPYITATLYQVDYLDNGIIEFRQFDEFCLENPNNKTDKLCHEIIRHWGEYLKNGLFFYGDPSGRKSDTRTLEHDYAIIERIFRKYLNNTSNRVPYKHPPVIKRRGFINNIFEEKYNIRVIIDPSCKKSIADFEFVKEDINGRKAKVKVVDRERGLTYEKYGHTSDSFDYIVCEVFKRDFIRTFE